MGEAEQTQDQLPDRMFMCTICGWLYEEDRGVPEEGIPAGTRWEDVPEDFVCPECGAGKDWFQELQIGD